MRFSHVCSATTSNGKLFRISDKSSDIMDAAAHWAALHVNATNITKHVISSLDIYTAAHCAAHSGECYGLKLICDMLKYGIEKLVLRDFLTMDCFEWREKKIRSWEVLKTNLISGPLGRCSHLKTWPVSRFFFASSKEQIKPCWITQQCSQIPKIESLLILYRTNPALWYKHLTRSKQV